MFIKEACVENFTDVPKLIHHGANRIELCDNLAAGGTTVSEGVLKATLIYCQAVDVPVMAIIRPRGGDFFYSETEKSIMRHDIQLALDAGVDGLVIGALTNELELDISFLKEVQQLTAKYGTDLTFHMAFDELQSETQISALTELPALGFSRVLTHGGPKNQDILDSVPRLQVLMDAAPAGFTILPGGGLTKDNLPQLQQALPQLSEAHGTKIV